MLRIILLEIKDILNFCSTESIDRLRVITHDAQVLMSLAQLLQNQILSEVRILVLIDHYVPESSCNALKSSRIVTKQDIHIQEDVIKVHHSGLLAFSRIQLVDVADSWFLSCSIILHSSSITTISRCCNQIILGHGYTTQNILRLIDLIIQLKLLQTGLYCTHRITRIIDRKGRRVSQRLRELSQKSDEYRVESTHTEPPGPLFSHHQGDSLLHFRSCLLRKRQSQNLSRIASFFENIGNPACQHPGLSRSRTRHYQHWSVNTTYSAFLLAVQSLQNSTFFIFHNGCKNRQNIPITLNLSQKDINT